MSTSTDSERPPAQGPLVGVSVIELGSLIAGPFAGRLLADLGAQVIKVESPCRPDPLRAWGHRLVDGRSLWWAVQSRNKYCVTADLDTEQGQRQLGELLVDADVLVENFRPGTLERWGLSWDRLREINPGLVLVRVSGYGQTGPAAGFAGYASVAEAESGLRSMNGSPGQEPPPRMGVSLGDSVAGLYAAFGALAALRERDRTGRGQIVDVSLLEACLAFTESAVPEYDMTGYVRGQGGTGFSKLMIGAAPSNAFHTSDGRWMVVAANHDRVFVRLASAMGQRELADDPRFSTASARSENRDECEELVANWVAERDADVVERVLRANGVACGLIRGVDDLLSDQHLRARDALVEHRLSDGRSFRGPGIVPRFSETPGGVRWTGADRPGAHDHEIRAGSLVSVRQQDSVSDDERGEVS